MSRFKAAFKARIDALLAPAPDPRVVYADGAERQQQLLTAVRYVLTDLKAAHHRLTTRSTLIEAQLPRFDDQARQALRSGREDLARLALQRRQSSVAGAEGLDDQALGTDKEAGHQ